MTRALLISLTAFQVTAYAQVPIGSWNAHLPMQSFQWVGENSGYLFAANTQGLLRFNKVDNSVSGLNKTNGLSETSITAFACDSAADVCLVGYSNGNLDILQADGSVINQPALLNSSIVGSKTINGFVFSSPEKVWIASDLRLLEYNLASHTVGADHIVMHGGLQQPPKQLSIFNDTVFVCSPSGLYKQALSALESELEFTAVSFTGSPSRVRQFWQANNNLYLTHHAPNYSADTVYQYSANSFLAISPLSGLALPYIAPYKDGLIICHPYSVQRYDAAFQPQENIYTFSELPPSPRMAISAQKKGKVLVADGASGLVVADFSNVFAHDIYAINSPKPGPLTVLRSIDNDIYGLPGGSERAYLRPTVSRLKQNTWSTTDLDNGSFPTLRNGSDIEPFEDYFVFSADRGGLAVLSHDLETQSQYNEDNSPIHDLFDNSDYNYYGITAIEKDEDHNLYMLHSKSQNPLKILLSDNTWLEVSFESMTPPLITPGTGPMLRLSNGWLACVIAQKGLLIYDPNGTPEILADDRFKLLTTAPNEGSLPNPEVGAIAEDLDHELWIGTVEGIAVIYSLESIFDEDFSGAERIVVNQDGYNGHLFETESITAIVVDGANRKWVGTALSGLYLISEDGTTQIHAFNKDNSPLLSNAISSLAVHPESGEVFIAAEEGLLSYRSDATTGRTTLDSVIVFPNPIKPGYNGNIAISRLTENAFVRITDVNGSLVFETQSVGGQAIWNGNDMSGNRVRSGLYLVFVAAEDGSQGIAERILFLE